MGRASPPWEDPEGQAEEFEGTCEDGALRAFEQGLISYGLFYPAPLVGF